MTPRILLIEDNATIASALTEHLQIEGFIVDHAETGEAGLEAYRAAPAQLIVLDLMLPGMSGERVLRSLRGEGCLAPVLILSARDQEVDKVRGFRLGADDYVTKPFGLLELIARIDALLRRSEMREKGTAQTRIESGRVTFDLAGQQILLDGAEVALRPKERELIFALLDRSGQTVSRDRLLRDVWGYANGVDSRTVDWHIAELRRKLDDDATNPTLIRTVRSVGYMLVLRPMER